MKQKLTISAKTLAIMLLFLSVAIASCKKDNSAQEEVEESTTNDPRLLGRWSNTTSTGSSSTLISTYEFKAGQVVTKGIIASSTNSGMRVISDDTFKWTTTNNNTVSFLSIGGTSTSKYVVDGKKLVFTSSNNVNEEYVKVEQ